jgi:transposase
MEQLEQSIERYLDELDRADRQPAAVPAARVAHLKEKIAAVKAQMRKLGQIGRRLQRTPDQQVSLTDPDARSMATSGRGTGMVGYNVQTAVDTKHHMIVAHEVTNVGHDRTQLASMARLARDAVGRKKLTVLADRGYFAGEEIVRCAQEGISPLVPKPLTSTSKADGRFDKRDFVYNARRDEYRCPAGERAIWRMTTVERGMTLHRYWPSACPRCPIKQQCTPGDYRRITRWEHEQVLDAMQDRLARTPEASRLRRQTVEHTFGTLKAWMGSTHFLTKTLERVRTEMSLHVLAYNLKRLISLLGVEGAIAAISG